MNRDLIIDGYNLMHAAGFARSTYGPGGLERSRNRLLARLTELLTPEERQRATVVFDARDAPAGRSDVAVRHDIYVLFARELAEADDLIENLIARHSTPKKLLVVSSDHRLHKAARRRKATACDSDVFLDRLERRVARAGQQVDEAEEADQTETELSAAEIQQWMNEFADVDVEQVRREVGMKPKSVGNPDAGNSPKSSDRKVPQLDENEVAMWEDLLGEVLREDGEDARGA